MINNLKAERKIMFKNQIVEDAGDIEIRLAEGYFTYYQETKNQDYLNHSYNHLVLAKTIVIENQNYLDLCKLEMLKGLLAAELKLPEQAQPHLEEALKIALENDLEKLKIEINEFLEQLKKGTIELLTDSILKEIFKSLSFRRLQSKQKKVIYSIWEEEVSLVSEQQICLMCKGKISGFNNFICNCKAMYCEKCARALVELENACWACNKPIDPSKPVKLPKKEGEVKILNLPKKKP